MDRKHSLNLVAQSNKFELLVVDDHPMFRKGLISVLERYSGATEILQAETVQESLNIVQQRELDLIIMDWYLPGGNGGVSSLLSLSQISPKLPIVVISANESVDLVVKVLSIGARGFIPKSANEKVICAALTLVMNGETYIPSFALEHLVKLDNVSAQSKNCPLTQRQLEVLQWIAKGYSNKKISQILSIADTTVRAHVSDIINALNAKNRIDAAGKARVLGILDQFDV